MASLKIENLDENVERELRRRAEEHGVSLEQEVRRVLALSVVESKPPRRKPTVAELERLSIRPSEPFDLKKWSDEAWEEGLR